MIGWREVADWLFSRASPVASVGQAANQLLCQNQQQLHELFLR